MMIAITARARHALLRRRGALKALYAENEEERKRLESEPEPDWPDRALAEESRTLLGRLSDGERQEMDVIDAALARIREGTWGKCAHCGEPIEHSRLMVLPEATTCIECSGASRRILRQS